jgi:hypothetical protein
LLHLILRSRACAASRRMGRTKKIVGWAKAHLRRAHLYLRAREGGHACALPTLRLLAMRKTYVLIPAAGFRPRFAISLSLSLKEGAGKAGRRLRPHRRVLKAEKMHTDLTGTAETSRLSPRDGFTAYFVLSPVSGLYCHRCRPRTGGADRRQGRGARTTRLRRPLRRFRPVKRSPDVTASIASQAQRIVTIAKRPSVGARRTIDNANQNYGKAEYFSSRGLTRFR